MVLRFLFLLLSCCTWAFGQDYQVLGIGAPCMDLVMHVDSAFIQEIGNKGGSQQTDSFYVDTIMQLAKTRPTKIACGGSCSNTIKGLASLGHTCAFFGQRGNDEMGRRYIAAISKQGIKPLCLCVEGPTQLCACFVTDDGERTMRCYPGVANQLTASDLSPEIFKGVSLVHIEGYMLYVPDKNYLPTAMRLAKEAGATVSFDLSSYELVRMQRERILHLLQNYVDIVFANVDEVRELTGLDPVAGCSFIQKMCRIAVVMQGKDGCIVGSEDLQHHCPTSPKQVVDCTGAGDLFASGFLHGYLENKSLEKCATYGNVTGGSVCEVYGAEIPAERWPTIQETMKH